MTPEQQSKIQQLFDRFASVPFEERSVLLKEVIDDPAVHNEVLLLLDAHDKAVARGFMNSTVRESLFEEPGEESLVGQTIGTFEIKRKLGAGGYGEVYLAWDQKLRRNVAMKRLNRQFRNDPERRKLLEAEAVQQAGLSDVRGITILHQLYESQTDDVFLIMEYVEGVTLRKRIDTPLSLEEFKRDAIALAEAVRAAHDKRVIHGDLKPENVMITKTGDLKVCDFGLARTLRNAGSISISVQPGANRIAGTPAYMAPELFAGVQPGRSPVRPNRQSDVFSLGVVFYQMLAGTNPFDGGQIPMTLERVQHYSPPRLSHIRPEVPAELDRLIFKMIEKNPASRYQSLDTVCADLNEIDIRAESPFKTSYIAAVLGAVVVALTAWFGFTYLDHLRHPLPEKRFVALMAWPASPNSSHLPLLKGSLDAMGARLARAEGSVRNLMIISTADVAGQSSVRTPADAVTTLGANLILAASLEEEGDGVSLDIALLDAATSSKLRSSQVHVKAADVNKIPDQAAASAAKLLEISIPNARLRDSDELRSLAPPLYELFMGAEDLAAQPNDAGLDQAIQKYQKVLDDQPRFALALAKLSSAYVRKFQTSHDPAVLKLAERNAELAVRYNEDSVSALLSRARVDLFSGNTQKAVDTLQRGLQLDPGNPEILLAKALAFRSVDRRGDEETVYREILMRRPNFWYAYQLLGLNLWRQGKLPDAESIFSQK